MSMANPTVCSTPGLTIRVSARKWNDTIREANEDLASGRRRARAARGGDSAPPRLSAQGFRSVATLLRQRERADEVKSPQITEIIDSLFII